MSQATRSGPGEGERLWFVGTLATIRVPGAGVPATAPTLPPPETPRPSADELSRIFAAHGQVNLGPPLAPES